MKKFLVVLLLVFSTNSQADNWVIPLIGGLVGGAIIGNVIAQPNYSAQYYQQPQVVYMPPQVYVENPMTAPVYYYQQPPNIYYQQRHYYSERGYR